MRLRVVWIILLGLFISGWTVPVKAQANVQVVSDKAAIAFPETIKFSSEFKSTAALKNVVLQYGVDQLTCGTVQAEAFPVITAGTDVKAEWTWEMRESGSLPPGANVWWQWQVTDESGAQFTSPKQTIVWLDVSHSWQTIPGGNINLHYYNGGADFGQQLHDAAAAALVRLSKDIGLTPKKPVDIYIFADTNDLKAAVLYAPAWVGGQAFPENNIVILGVSTDQLDWGKSSEAHELTHVLVGQLTFSCLSFMPTWLNEGLAMYGEGGPQAGEQAQFDQAKANNELPTLRSLIGGFSEESSRANISYSEAYSVVNFMVKTYGQDKMIKLLDDLKNGQTMDAALQDVYSFKLDDLEAAWRKSIGAQSAGTGGQPTPAATPTVVPTIVPIGAVPVAQPAASTPLPAQAQPTDTSASLALAPTQAGASTQPNAIPTAAPRGLGSLSFTTFLEIGGGCLLAALLLIGLPVFFITRSRRRRPQ